ncbi:hypothetical protein HDV05_006178 [Chytridiales sp. JEL 0842]|nr:hypothetical protein HDV05_006178 [Chytridiales sp. JEL 0842]
MKLNSIALVLTFAIASTAVSAASFECDVCKRSISTATEFCSSYDTISERSDCRCSQLLSAYSCADALTDTCTIPVSDLGGQPYDVKLLKADLEHHCEVPSDGGKSCAGYFKSMEVTYHECEKAGNADLKCMCDAIVNEADMIKSSCKSSLPVNFNSPEFTINMLDVRESCKSVTAPSQTLNPTSAVQTTTKTSSEPSITTTDVSAGTTNGSTAKPTTSATETATAVANYTVKVTPTSTTIPISGAETLGKTSVAVLALGASFALLL